MSSVDTDVKKLAENVSSLQKDMAQVGVLVDRLDITIEKLTEVSSTVSQLLAVQGSRLEFSEKVQEKLQDLVEKRRQETDDNIKAVYVRIEKVEKDLQIDMETSENKIITKIEEMQKWMWTAMGGGIVVLWILNSIDLAKFFN